MQRSYKKAETVDASTITIERSDKKLGYSMKEMC